MYVFFIRLAATKEWSPFSASKISDDIFVTYILILIPPRIWVFMTRDWDHSFGVRDAETTFSKTNLANGGRELSAHVWPAFRRRLIKKQHQQDVLDRICQI